MSAKVIDGKAVAARVRAQLAEEVAAFTAQTGRVPGLATVLVGDDPASARYVANKQRACAEIGMEAFDRRLPADATYDSVAHELQTLSDDPAVSGILLQLPVPGHLDGPTLTGMVPPEKDVDGLTPVNAGLLALGRDGLRPCTPQGVMELLADAGAELEGKEAVVVGRSNLFGKPMAQLLLSANATVTVCHSRTHDLEAVCARADVLIAAVGRARIIGAGHVKPGAVVIDVGMNQISPEEAGNKSGIVGDVDFAAAAEVASAITPVPGGVGPTTVAFLLRNTLQAARHQADAGSRLGEVQLERA
ncbi:MAG TPA: bifunctional methylenetetrahydrofolate dehydrogenase/methenyltetrahydrofolate cyclohydrolase FolD [Solirubrobacteraceae bacterium]|jgi:methylenetetrahydrofolate dehydrogenase (NADP+)/methenyltetrahydrofolate cyclohydrolase|nr:bifunctional methylenetetrahydrofolate dehydrogenase/methenyltetrahydrofolate cyclohydrolase FolD [Solirubrobacteraceae bacterium]